MAATDVARVAGLVAALLGVAVAHPALAQAVVEADLRGGYYVDTDATDIITSAVQATVRPVPEVSFGGHYLADIVSTASVDVVTAATDRWEETRHEGLGNAGYKDSERSLSGTYIYSVENDWRSHTGSLAMSHDLLDHQVTIGVGGAFGYNMVGRSGDVNFAEEMFTGTGNLEAAFVLSPDDLLASVYSFNFVSGYQASPYRFVRFDGALAGATLSAPERLPETRARNSVALRYNRHLVAHSFLRMVARGYLDDWGVASGTLSAEFVQGFIDALELGVFVRGYVQSSAAFYEDDYPDDRVFLTADRELSAFADGFGGLRFGFDVRKEGPFESIRGEVKGTAFAFRFFEFSELEERYGVIAEVGLGASL